MTKQKINLDVFTSRPIVQTIYSDAIDISDVNDLAITVSADVQSPSNTTFISGTPEVQTMTFPSKAGSTDRDYFVVEAKDGTKFAIYLDKTGSSVAPTGAIYAAVASGKKSKADISGATDAASVAAIVETALNALTGFTALITTDDSAADGTMLLTQVHPGATVNPVVKNLDDSGAGSIAGVETTPGVAGTIDLTTEYITIAAHGYTTGQKVRLTTSSALPTGLAAGTDYYVIVIDANTIALASSLAFANAGTAINITAYGSGTQTVIHQALAGGDVQLQKSGNGTVWFDVSGKNSAITVDADTMIEVEDAPYKWARIKAAATAGRYLLTVNLSAKES